MFQSRLLTVIDEHDNMYLYLQESHLKKSLCEQVAGLVSGFGVQMKVSIDR